MNTESEALHNEQLDNLIRRAGASLHRALAPLDLADHGLEQIRQQAGKTMDEHELVGASSRGSAASTKVTYSSGSPIRGATVDELVGLFDSPKVAEALYRWAALTDRTIVVTLEPWSAAGYGTARLATLYINESGHQSHVVVAKVLPPEEAVEPKAHRQAIREAPEAFRSHFAQIIFDPVLLSSGQIVTFQQLAGDSRDWRPLSAVPAIWMPDAGAELTRALILDWNSDYRTEPVHVLDVIRHEVGPWVWERLSPALPSSLWLRADDDPPMPNPVRLLAPDSLFATHRIDVVCGRVHGDLHDRNVLVQTGADVPRFDTFVLVDLMTYRPDRQLGQDLVALLLSIVGRMVVDLTAVQRTHLLSLLIRPTAVTTEELPDVVVDTVRAIYQTAAESLRGVGSQVWHRQYLLSLVGRALPMSAYRTLPEVQRWWSFRLAGWAAHELLKELDGPTTAPTDTPCVTRLP